MKITFLGTGNAFVPQRDWSCVLVNDTLLLDAGPTVLPNLKRLALDPARIQYLLLSHFHGDHFLGIPFLFLEYYFQTPTTTPLTILGPRGLAARIHEAMTLAYPDVLSRGWPRPLKFIEVCPGELYRCGETTVEAVPVTHGTLEAFGYRVHLPDGLLVYTGDASLSESLLTLVQEAQVAVVEANSALHSPLHLGREALTTLLAQVPATCQVFLTHLDSPTAAPWAAFDVIVPTDLMSYEVTPRPDARPQLRELTSPASETARRLGQRTRQLQAVLRISHSLQRRLELHELFEQAVLTAMATIDADAGSLLLHDSATRRLIFRHVEGPSKEKITGLSIADNQGIAGDVFQTGTARISDDVTTDRAHLQDIDRASHYQTRTMITVPLQAGTGEIIGVMQMLNKLAGTFDEDDLAVLHILATQVAAAIITTRLFEQSQAAAMVELLGHLSHDIKNLLTPVLLASQTLQGILGDFNTDARACLAPSEGATLSALLPPVLDRLQNDTGELLAILDESTLIAQQRSKEIADMVKGLTAPPSLAPTDLNEIIQSVCRVLRYVAEVNGVHLHLALTPCPALPLDATGLYNAIYNLVNNAIGATDREGTVTVQTRRGDDSPFPGGSYLEVGVCDTGCGMPPDKAATLFTGHHASTKPGGTGLGTRVVRRVIDAHRGVLQVISAPGAGTTITFRLPFTATPIPSRNASPTD
jgi:signal transduction histidine kinase/ribonuclease BN (tRNA processing enzyme)